MTQNTEYYKIVLVRHGESEWNQQNIFAGWFNAGLSEKGQQEAIHAGKALRNDGYKFDLAFTSFLTRAQNTLQAILTENHQLNLPTVKTWRLNERHFGGLTGLNKTELIEKYGEEQVRLWRKSFVASPPPMKPDNKYYKSIIEDPRYKHGPNKEEFPTFESVEMAMARILPFWNDNIVPEIKNGKKILIVAHGYVIRVIIKILDKISIDDIMDLYIPTGIPFSYTLDNDLKAVTGESMKFIGDPEMLIKAMEQVAQKGKEMT